MELLFGVARIAMVLLLLLPQMVVLLVLLVLLQVLHTQLPLVSQSGDLLPESGSVARVRIRLGIREVLHTYFPCFLKSVRLVVGTVRVS